MALIRSSTVPAVDRKAPQVSASSRAAPRRQIDGEQDVVVNAALFLCRSIARVLDSYQLQKLCYVGE